MDFQNYEVSDLSKYQYKFSIKDLDRIIDPKMHRRKFKPRPSTAKAIESWLHPKANRYARKLIKDKKKRSKSKGLNRKLKVSQDQKSPIHK